MGAAAVHVIHISDGLDATLYRQNRGTEHRFPIARVRSSECLRWSEDLDELNRHRGRPESEWMGLLSCER